MGLVARHAEAAGIPTLCMTSARDITRAVNPPRAAFLDFPLGHTTGKPHAPDLQRRILVEALSSFETLTVPSSMKEFPFRWSEDEEWKAKAFAEGDDRAPRHDTPQFQDGEDLRRAEVGGSPSLPFC